MPELALEGRLSAGLARPLPRDVVVRRATVERPGAVTAGAAHGSAAHADQTFPPSARRSMRFAPIAMLAGHSIPTIQIASFFAGRQWPRVDAGERTSPRAHCRVSPLAPMRVVSNAISIGQCDLEASDADKPAGPVFALGDQARDFAFVKRSAATCRGFAERPWRPRG